MPEILNAVNNYIITLTPKIVSGLAILLGFWIGGMILRNIIVHFGKRSRVHYSIFLLFGRLINTAMIILGLISAMGTMGVNVSALVASLGLTGFALGFALKDALSNILAGVLILFYRPFRVGDRIQITGLEGEVVEIDLRYTTLQTQTSRILIPNSNIFSNPVIIPT